MQIATRIVPVLILIGLIACEQSSLVQPQDDFELNTEGLVNITSATDDLTDEEEAELDLRAQITFTEIDVVAETGDADWAQIWVATEATVPFFIFFPRIRHDVLVSYTVDGTPGSYMIPGDFDIYADGQRFDVNEVPLSFFNCSSIAESGQIAGQSEHRARWNYFKLGGLLSIERGPITRNGSDNCPPPPDPEDPEEGPSGGGWIVDEEECQFCQHWLLYEDGIIVDDWWECFDIHPDDPLYELCGLAN